MSPLYGNLKILIEQVHVYKISQTKLESLCYYWTENDPINVEFRTNQNQLHSVEQKISRKVGLDDDVFHNFIGISAILFYILG